MNSKRRYIYVDSSSGTATSSIPYQSPSPQEALRGRYGNNDCYTFPMTKPSSVGLSEACYTGTCTQIDRRTCTDTGIEMHGKRVNTA